jgi:hypothetical protein
MPVTGADPPADIRAQLIDADLSPRPLYPARPPRLLRASDASIDVSGRRFTVTYDRGEGASGIGCVSFGRTRRGQLTKEPKQPRLRGYKPKRVKSVASAPGTCAGMTAATTPCLAPHLESC